MDDDPADLVGQLGAALHEIEQGGAEVVEHAGKAGAEVRRYITGHHLRLGREPRDRLVGPVLLRRQGLLKGGVAVDRQIEADEFDDPLHGGLGAGDAQPAADLVHDPVGGDEDVGAA